METGDIEVIVVPNGPDESWRQAMRPFKNKSTVRVIPIQEANANTARNKGLAEARGKFVRFLDDDDYLISEGTKKQYDLIIESGADIVSGGVQLVDERERCIDIMLQPRTDDLCAAMLGPHRFCQPTAHVYKRSSLQNLIWNTNTKVHQDYEWFFDLCASGEYAWVKTNEIVGVYWKHRKPRISTLTDYNSLRFKAIVPMLESTYRRLENDGRLNRERVKAVAQALWECVHRVFFLDPGYWSKIARKAQAIDRNVRPIKPIYNYYLLKNLDPLIVQWLLFPKRWIYYQFRLMRKKWWYWRYKN